MVLKNKKIMTRDVCKVQGVLKDSFDLICSLRERNESEGLGAHVTKTTIRRLLHG